MLFGRSPDYTLHKIFGCECFPYLGPYNSNKFSFRSKSCVFLGYSKPHTGHKCFDIQSRHVIFNEIVFPFQQRSSTESLSPNVPSPINFPLLLSLAHPISPTPDSLPTHSRDPSSFVPCVVPSPAHPGVSSHSNVPPTSLPISTLEQCVAQSPSCHNYLSNSHLPNPSPPLDPRKFYETPHPMSDAAPLIETFVAVPAAPHASQHMSSTVALHRTHHMVTRSQQNIYKPKRPTDGTIKYPIPRALIVSIRSTEAELT